MRRPWMLAVAAALTLAACAVSESRVVETLEGMGYDEVVVERGDEGGWTFTGSKGDQTCRGEITISGGSSSTHEVCVGGELADTLDGVVPHDDPVLAPTFTLSGPLVMETYRDTHNEVIMTRAAEGSILVGIEHPDLSAGDTLALRWEHRRSAAAPWALVVEQSLVSESDDGYGAVLTSQMGVLAGDYRMQVSADCCGEAMTEFTLTGLAPGVYGPFLEPATVAGAYRDRPVVSAGQQRLYFAVVPESYARHEITLEVAQRGGAERATVEGSLAGAEEFSFVGPWPQGTYDVAVMGNDAPLASTFEVTAPAHFAHEGPFLSAPYYERGERIALNGFEQGGGTVRVTHPALQGSDPVHVTLEHQPLHGAWQTELDTSLTSGQPGLLELNLTQPQRWPAGLYRVTTSAPCCGTTETTFAIAGPDLMPGLYGPFATNQLAPTELSAQTPVVTQAPGQRELHFLLYRRSMEQMATHLQVRRGDTVIVEGPTESRGWDWFNVTYDWGPGPYTVVLNAGGAPSELSFTLTAP